MTIRFLCWVLLFNLGLSACSKEDFTAHAAGIEAKPIALKVYKSPSCSCCGAWIEGLQNEGFTVSVEHPEDLYALKKDLGIASPFQSCHTAVSKEGYLFEGHIPHKFIRQFLSNPPSGAFGLSVPGMPVGSPGMEMGDRFMPYQVLQLNKDGTTAVYAEVKSPEDQR